MEEMLTDVMIAVGGQRQGKTKQISLLEQVAAFGEGSGVEGRA